jgi:hypothetical protein
VLTKFDEFTCHQIVSSFDSPESTDRAWTEKLWCNIHDTKGRLVMAIGMGVYPNRNVMDGYACIQLDGRQHNARFSRELRPRIDELEVGPLRWEVLEPYRRIRLSLGENRFGLRFELEFLGRFQPGEEEPQSKRSRGRLQVNTCRYSQLGRARGWVCVGDQRIELDEEHHYAQRDHSWGVRMGVGAPEQGVQEPDIATFTAMMINWATFQLDDRALNLYLIERSDGHRELFTGQLLPRLDDARPAVPIVGVEHTYRFHERSARMQSGELHLTGGDGTKLHLELRELCTMYLRGGGYVGWKGYTHGLWMGPKWEDGEVWELGSEPGLCDQVHGLDDTVCEVREGGEVKGYGIIENLILPPFPRYGFPAMRPR